MLSLEYTVYAAMPVIQVLMHIFALRISSAHVECVIPSI
jgi:hypothetical protein